MKVIKKYSLWLFGAMLCGALFASCKKNTAIESFKPDRAFTPTGITTTVSGASVKIDWKASLFSSGTGLTYTVDVSKVSTFATIDYTTTTTAATLTLTDQQLTVGQPYYVRIKANATTTTPGSIGYVATTSSFTMPGILIPVTNADLTSTSVSLKWLSAPDVTKITITPTSGTTLPFSVNLTPTDITAMAKLITGLKGDVSYRADIYAGTRVKGFTTFKTPLFTRIISPTDNMIDVINAAADGDVIGLADGTYDTKDAITALYANISITQKSITLQSVSGDPTKVIVNFKEIDLKGTGAGIVAKNITFDGNSTKGAAAYFLNLTGALADAEVCAFANITVDGCIVRNITNAFIRGNRGGTNGYTISNITINNTIAYNINQAATAGFNTIELTKVAFTRLDITNSTFYEFGRSLVVATTALNAGTPIPIVNINKSTFNSFGGNNMFIMVDANTNPINVTVQNSIVSNTPKTTAQGLFRGTGAGSTFNFNNNNTFALNNGTGGALPISTGSTTVQTGANTTTDLGWTSATTDFTLPAGSALRTSGTANDAIGDPRWAK